MHDTAKPNPQLLKIVDKDSETIRGLFADVECKMNEIHSIIESIKELVEEKCKLR